MAITDLDEQLLVRAHQAGDEHAFQQIVRSQHRALYAHAYRRLGNHESAEDAVQDTLLRAYRALPSFDGDLRLRAWLHRILTNVCHDEGKRRRRDSGLIDRLEAEPIELGADPIEEAVLHDTVRIMNDALAELPESYREALVLRYVDGLSFREVAEITGVTEENARARVHRGRLALHKVLSRVSIMVAFLVPGLRRAQSAPAEGGSAVASAEPTVSFATQLTSHAMNVAPTLTRVAEVASATSGAKTSMVATAVAAAAAVVAPVAAYRVYDTTKTPDAPAAAVASPADDQPNSFTSTTLEVAASNSAPTSSVPDATTSTLPESAVAPFAGGVPADDKDDEPGTTTTTTPTPTTAPPAEDPTTTVEGTIGGDAFDIAGARPDFEISGRAVLQGSGDPVSGVLHGGLYVSDVVGGEAITELGFTLDDGRELRVRFKGTLDQEEAGDGVTTWTMTGKYSVQGGESVGIADAGAASVVFRNIDGSPSSLTFDLRGQQASGS